MSYPGNPSLADEVQQKVLGTFMQTLDLAEAGKKEEALLGCDFIRRLDPQFKLADTLSERLESEEGELSVADLRSAAGGVSEEQVDELFSLPDVFDDVSDDEPEDSSDADLIVPSGTFIDAGTPEPPPEPPSASAAGPEPAAVLDKESEERLGQLLSEGQQAFEKAEYQSAIDAWSRIFLIDIDHPEANRRIELARKLKAEVERKVEESYHDALTAMEGGDSEAAAEGFRKVLKLQSSHLAAQEHLDRLSAGTSEPVPDELPEPGTADSGLPEVVEEKLADALAEEIPDSAFGLDPFSESDMYQPAVPEETARPTPSRRPSRRNVFVIAGLVMVVAVVAAWFLRSNWTRFFPNAGEEVVAPQRPRVDPIVRAQGLHLDGNTAMAISQLRRLPPAHPQYAEAQTLIAQWETVLEDDTDNGPSPDQLAERDEMIARGREAFANRDFLLAEEFFTFASQAAPLDEGTEALLVETLERLAPLRSEIEIFRQGEWDYALRSLWGKHEEEPGNRDIRRLMIDSYYNLGVRDLQRADPISATESLTEAVALAGSDPEIQRLLDFAETYSKRSPDLLYRIFVKYLPFR
jgi:tetratricopeptide (TPR) repeat protein